MWRNILCAFVFVVCAASVFAQYRAGIQGTVLDSQNTAISGATVTMISKETNRTQTATTDDAGVYNFLSLPPGRYTLTAEASGFKKKTLSDLTVSAEKIQAVNISLELGDVSQSVTVNGDVTPPLATETGQVSGTLTSREVHNLPALGRARFHLLRLAQGVTGDGSHTNNGGSQNTPGSAGPGGTSASSSIFQTENQV